jgi:hypothetical protein
VKTRWNSCATPIATTLDTPVWAAASSKGRITSALRWSLPKRTTGMALAVANRATARRNRSPIGPNSAGEGIGLPRCWVKNVTTCPPTCRLGT